MDEWGMNIQVVDNRQLYLSFFFNVQLRRCIIINSNKNGSKGRFKVIKINTILQLGQFF